MQPTTNEQHTSSYISWKPKECGRVHPYTIQTSCCGLYYTKREQILCIWPTCVRSTVNLQSFISLCGVAIFYTANSRQISCVWCSFSNDWTRTHNKRLKHNTFDCILLVRVLYRDITKYIAHVVWYTHTTHARLLFCVLQRWLWAAVQAKAQLTACVVAVALFYDES